MKNLVVSLVALVLIAGCGQVSYEVPAAEQIDTAVECPVAHATCAVDQELSCELACVGGLWLPAAPVPCVAPTGACSSDRAQMCGSVCQGGRWVAQ